MICYGSRKSRAQMVDSSPACYPATRAWARVAYLQTSGAQAISYGSKCNDSGRYAMLFKQRMPGPPFKALDVEPSAICARRAEAFALVRSLGLHEVWRFSGIRFAWMANGRHDNDFGVHDFEDRDVAGRSEGNDRFR